MNSLGQIKSLLDLQLLRGMTNHTPSQQIPNHGLDFESILQEAIVKNDSSSPTNSTMFMNTLGAVLMENRSFSDLNQTILSTINVSNKERPKKVHASSYRFDDLIEKAANFYQVPKKLIQSIIKHESNFNPNAISHAGATGLMQLMPTTARGLGVSDIFDPEQNIMAGSKYIRQMLDRYSGDIRLALAAYNAGPGNVNKYGGIPPFKETQNYVKKVIDTFYN